MQVFNVFFKVLKKKMPVSLIYIIVFVSIAIPMSKIGSKDSTFKASKLDVCVFDEDGTTESAALTELIGKKHKLVEVENNKDAITDALYYESADYILIINKGYSEKLSAGETDGLFSTYHMHDSYGTVLMGQFLNEYTGAVCAYTAGGMDIETAIANAADAVSLEAEVEMASFEEGSGDPDFSRSFSSYFQYLPYILISVLMNSLCPVLLAFNRKDIKYRTNCSSVKANSYTMQIFAGSAVYIAVVWLIFMVVAVMMNGGMLQGKALTAALNSFIFALVSASITIFISGFDPSPNLVNLLTQIVGLGMSFLCGIFVPQSMLGDGVLAAARFLPAYWYVRVNNMLCGIEMYDSSKVAAYLAIEAAFAAAFTSLTLLVRKISYSRPAVRAKTAKANS